MPKPDKTESNSKKGASAPAQPGGLGHASAPSVGVDQLDEADAPVAVGVDKLDDEILPVGPEGASALLHGDGSGLALPPAILDADGVASTLMAHDPTTGITTVVDTADPTARGTEPLAPPEATTAPAPPSDPIPPVLVPPAAPEGFVRARVGPHGALKMDGKIYKSGELVDVPRDRVEHLAKTGTVEDPRLRAPKS